MKGSDPEEAIDEFLAIPALEPEKGEWGFKGLKQAIKIEYRLGRYDDVRRPKEEGSVIAFNLPFADCCNYLGCRALQ
jgi:hypothetical protein